MQYSEMSPWRLSTTWPNLENAADVFYFVIGTRALPSLPSLPLNHTDALWVDDSIWHNYVERNIAKVLLSYSKYWDDIWMLIGLVRVSNIFS